MKKDPFNKTKIRMMCERMGTLVTVLLMLGPLHSADTRHHRRHRPELPRHILSDLSLPPLPDPPANRGSLHQGRGESDRCEFHLPNGCSCSKSSPLVTYSITCFQANLLHIPKIDIGPKLIKTLNLEANHLSRIQMGDFYGLKIERLLLANNSLDSLPLLAFWGLEFHLKTLDLSYNYLVRVPSDALRLLRNLRSLSLTANRITALYHYDFGYLQQLNVLTLDKNPIAQLSTAAFLGTQLSLVSLNSIDLSDGLGTISGGCFDHLRGLSLASNTIHNIPSGWFGKLQSLKYLNLEKNNLRNLANDTFTGVENSLHILVLNKNAFDEVPLDALRSLRFLVTIQLNGNNLEKIHASSFNGSHLLQNLDLSSNSIRQLNTHAFQGLDNIEMIDLRYNQLIILDDRTFYWSPPGDRKIYLSHNPWLCNCVMKWFKREHKRGTRLATIFADSTEMMCSRPQAFRNRPILRLGVRDFTCNHSYYNYHYETQVQNQTNGGWLLEENGDNYDYEYYDYDEGYDDAYYDDVDEGEEVDDLADRYDEEHSQVLEHLDKYDEELDTFDLDTYRRYKEMAESQSDNTETDQASYEGSGSGDENVYDDDDDAGYIDYSDQIDVHGL